MNNNVALLLEYDGSQYHGWQFQNDHLPTVQRDLEMAISQVANKRIKVVCAGRTDAGVHALKQVVNFKSDVKRELKAWVMGCNTLLPKAIAIKWAGGVSEHFHARFSATSRRYRYVIKNTTYRPGISFYHQTWHRYPLDAKLMHEAGQLLLGENDFQSFRGAGCQSKSSFRELTDLQVFRNGDLVIIEVQANAFLLHMVRNIVGVLLEVGQSIKAPEWVGEVLESKDRTQAGITASPNGLYLTEVDYPSEFEIPSFVE